MLLYVANCTPQLRVFEYRMLETNQLRRQDIQPGQQIALSGTFTPEEAKDIVEQHAHYGMYAASEMNQARNYIHLLWSADKYVSAAQMKLALERNLQLKLEEGEKTRQAVALGVADIVQREHPDNYTGLQVELRDARKDVGLDLNEIHTHRKDGDYGRGNEFGAPLSAAKRGRARRKAA